MELKKFIKRKYDLKIILKGDKKNMELEEFLRYMDSGLKIEGNSEVHEYMHKLSQEAMKITYELNSTYHEPHEICIVPDGSTSKVSPVAFTLAVSFPAALTSRVCSATHALHLFLYDLLNSEMCFSCPHTSHFLYIELSITLQFF